MHHLHAAISGGGADPVVRIPENEPILVKRLLDCGTRSIMFPYVGTTEEARQAVMSTRYPPHGICGFAGGSRATSYGRVAGYADRASDEICVIVQVETPAAMDAIPEIGAVEGVDCIFIGPNDLAANMGFLGKANAPEVKQAADGTVPKRAATDEDLLQHEGPAIVFETYRDMLARIDDPAQGATPDSVLVMRECGPVGAPGMPEWGMLPIPKPLLAQGVRDMVRISECRMSGTCVLHVCPESRVGGPLRWSGPGT